MDGLILVGKPPNVTSHSIVLQIRNILGIRRVGHYGTLDPMATGLLVVAVGKATRLFPFFSKTDKAYKGQIRLGYSTDTYDSQGQPTSQETEVLPSEKSLIQAMKSYEGEITQIPPPFSAKKYKGKPLYALARQKKEFELKPQMVVIHSFRLSSYKPPFIHFTVHCSSGTYVRSLAHGLGQKLGCGAHLSQLTRTKVGDFSLSEAFSLEEIEKHIREGRTEQILIPLEFVLPEFPKVVLKEEGAVLAKRGQFVYPEDIVNIFSQEIGVSDLSENKEVIFKLFSLEGKLLAFGRKIPDKNGIHPFLVLD